MSKRSIGIVALVVYGLSIYLANWMIANVGYPIPGVPDRHLLPVGFGLMATSGTYAAALVLVARDIVQRSLGRVYGYLIILPAAVLVAFLDPYLAIASCTSFLFSESVDFLIYTPLQARGLGLAVFASSLIASAVDSVLFLTLAHIPLASVLPGLLVGRLWVSIAAYILIKLARYTTSRSTAHALS